MARFQYPIGTEPVSTSPETVTEDRWHQPWSEPVRQRIAPQLAVALIASGLAYVNAGPFAEPVTEDRFHAAWSEPVREKVNRQLATALIASGATVPPIAPFPETVTEDRWHQPWSEPVRVKPALPAGEQQFLALQPWPADPYGWFNWLAEPVRVRPALPSGEHLVLALDPVPFVKIDWFGALAEPVRVRPALPAPAQQFLAPDPLPRVSFGWWAPLTEPVRIRPALPTPEQHVLELEPFPVVTVWWLTPLSEPVRTRWLPPAEQQFSPFAEDIVFADRWFQWWSEPVRYKLALGAASQPYEVSYDVLPLPFLGGGGGWFLPDPSKPPAAGEEASPRKVKKPGSPRQVEPEPRPPTFAETIAAQQPARLVDLLGARFAAQLGQQRPPAFDIYVPPHATPPSPRPTPIASSVLNDIEDRLDAARVLEELDRQEEERIIAMLVAYLSKKGSA